MQTARSRSPHAESQEFGLQRRDVVVSARDGPECFMLLLKGFDAMLHD